MLSSPLRPAGLARFRPLLALSIWYVALGVLLRIVLWWVFGRAQQVSAATFVGTLGSGALADFIQTFYLLAPFAVFLWLAPDRLYRSVGVRRAVFVGAFVWMFALTFVAAIEYFFFEEFDARLNLVAVDYLMYPTEVVGDIWDAYPVVKVLIGVGIFTAAVVYALRRYLQPAVANTSRFLERTAVFAGFALITAIFGFAFETHTLTFSDNRVANEIAANGASSFFRALRTNEIDYHTYYASRSSHANLNDLVAQLGGGEGKFTRLAEGRMDRTFAGDPNGLGKLNIVVIASESFGAEFSKLYGSTRDWTPEFDSYARQGVWFRHMYASGTRTVRGLEAIATSLPPIPSVSVLRRPGNEGIANWGTVMQTHGYRTSFLYGGYGYFDNMNYFFGHNGFEVRDREQIRKPLRFENIWGVADEDLYDSALSYYDDVAKSGKPFFSIIMNTSNHKPFTFRAGVPGVKPQGGGRESGVRYADFAQGYFLREAHKHAWFDNTLFVIVADHGARVYGREEIPLKSYEIPMMFYAPKHLRPGQVDALTTQIDIAPTVLGLLGLSYHAPFFGEDVLHTRPGHRVAFFSHNHDVALYEDGQLAILGLNKSVSNVFYDPATDSYKPAPPNERLNDLAVAYYQTAFELFRERRYN
ncbi:MAG TPA: sulfatase-like hydrolase/transferase [Steroidobacteraceae bacterium]|nr:sulfatase-like hydrolase/transferase [Steroidobacteraceae bacterium]